MNEDETTPQEEPTPLDPDTQIPPEPGPSPVLTPTEVEEGKAFAILSYALSFVGLPFFLVPLIMRNNAFALYHAKQCLILWLAGIAAGIVSVLLSFVCIGILLGPIAGILLIVLCIMGLVNASKGVTEPLPVIGPWGEEWFKGLTVTT